MKSMKPLLYLTYKTFWNGVKRALGSPTRLIGLLFFVGYYFMFFVRPAMFGGREFDRAFSRGGNPILDFPPLELLNGVAFAVFAMLSLFMMLGGMAQQGGFKQSDVDVLFPTPIPPRMVLVFRMIRDYLLTLIVPFFFALVGFMPVKAGWEALFRNIPNKEYAPLVFRAGFMAWMLMAMCWVALNYAISLTINRSDLGSDRNRKMLFWGLGTAIAATVFYAAYALSRATGASDVLAVSFSPLLRSVLFTASFATMLTLAPLEGSLTQGLLGAGGLLAILGLSFAVAFRQAGWLYDQAATKTSANAGLKQAQRQGDIFMAVAESARSGKTKTRRFDWLGRQNMRGPWALIWKDLFLQFRGMLTVIIILFVIGVMMALLPVLAPEAEEKLSQGAFFLMMQGFALFTSTLSLANVGYLEMLRRVDLQKPLPFSPSVSVLFEVASKAVLGIIVCAVASVLATVLRPSMWPEALAAVLFVPPLSVLMSAVVFLVIILFPDMDDQTQKQFRGLLMMLSLAVLALPPILAFIGLAIAGLPIYVAALAGALLCAGISWLVIAIGGRQYAQFNPAE